jgi:hypothetical protein
MKKSINYYIFYLCLKLVVTNCTSIISSLKSLPSVSTRNGNISIDFGGIYSYYKLHLIANLWQNVIYVGACFAVAIYDFDIFRAVTMNIVFFWNIMPFNHVEFFWRYIWIYYFNLPVRNLSRRRKRACMLRDRVSQICYTWEPIGTVSRISESASLSFPPQLPWKKKRQFPSKRCYISNTLNSLHLSRWK